MQAFRLLTYILRSRGYQVLDAAHGDEALAIFAERGDSIHLLLTDMVMPKMNGRELAERLAPDPSGPESGLHVRLYRRRAGRTGALSPGMSFLQKPLRPDKLAATVRAPRWILPLSPFNPR